MYYVYILLCSDESLYTGITNNLDKRLKEHNLSKGSKYVRSRLPFKLVYAEDFPDKSLAMKRELEIKSWSRKRKIEVLDLRL